MTHFYKFNEDFLYKIVNAEDIIIHNDSNIYNSIYVSSSLTHGGFSNNPPRKEFYDIINIFKSSIDRTKIRCCENIHKYVYISRRSWINADTTNIGTNYTTRRKMINEDLLVKELTGYGFVEIFAENLNVDEKINLFSNAHIVVGSIGGGMANLIFSSKNTKSIVIVTPSFLDVNYRFKHSMETSDVHYFNDVRLYIDIDVKKNSIPLYSRVCIIKSNQIGEICEYDSDNNLYTINMSNNDVAGFNNSVDYDKKIYACSDFNLLDQGLNSPYIVDILSIKTILSLYLYK
jgi:hypothetical protein